jgi:hypothetical protein
MVPPVLEAMDREILALLTMFDNLSCTDPVRFSFVTKERSHLKTPSPATPAAVKVVVSPYSSDPRLKVFDCDLCSLNLRYLPFL